MTTAKNRRIRPVAMVSALLASLLGSCQPCAPIWGPGYPDMGTGTVECGGNGSQAKWNTEFTLKDLAGEIDQLEKHIEKFGSIVPKQTDIWGEARLMLHRQEFEQQMSLDLSEFKESFQAWVYRSDQAYLASALSLQAAVSTRRRGSSQNVQSVTSPPAPNLMINPTDLISNPDKVPNVISRSPIQTATQSFKPPGYATSLGQTALALEPTLVEDQKARYLYHLNELRRINEGDDNSDAPGYTLNLVRIPISVLTGSCTQTGWGGECTVTATPHLPDDLLPKTFRAWVINDLVNMLTLPIVQIDESAKGQYSLSETLSSFYKTRDQLSDAVVQLLVEIGVKQDKAEQISRDYVSYKPQPQKTFGEWLHDQYQYRSEYDEYVKKVAEEATKLVINKDPKVTTAYARQYINRAKPSTSLTNFLRTEKVKGNYGPNAEECEVVKKGMKIDNIDRIQEQALRPIIYSIDKSLSRSLQPGRSDQAALSPSDLISVLGSIPLAQIAAASQSILQAHLAANNVPYHLDVQIFLTTELNAAYELLSSETYYLLWQHSLPDLVTAIKSQNITALFDIRSSFFRTLSPEAETGRDGSASGRMPVLKQALAWAILVESALLNDLLIKDMRATQTAKGCPIAPDGWLPFYLPHPPVETCQLFNDYVRSRWPLYVFALDPATDDQNVMDQYDMRREMQLALALAFTSGQIGAGSMTRYVRRIEEDMDTIAINRTMVGFSHGKDTFGWRFYPRVQTPPIPGNLEVIFRDMFLGRRGPRYDLRYRRLENGVRECDALVVMPAIVPYVDMEFTSNWFALANPKCKRLNLKQTMRLSQQVQAVRESSSLACDSHAYRPGDPALLMRRLEQLSQRLPLQHQLVNVPFENTHGGYEMLTTGVSNLAPRLSGWYGAPGIDPSKETNLFLVGNNFSVTQTRVIAGGLVLTPLPLQPPLPQPYPQPLNTTPPVTPQIELLSRQVVRVSIPKGAAPSPSGFVDVHVATPYGISAPLTVPVISGADAGIGYSVDPNKSVLKINYCWDPMMKKWGKASVQSGDILINWKFSTGSTLNSVDAEFLFNVGGKPVTVKIEKLKATDGVFRADKSQLQQFTDALLERIICLGPYSSQNTPLPSPLISSGIKIIPNGAPGTDVQSVPAQGSIRVELNQGSGP